MKLFLNTLSIKLSYGKIKDYLSGSNYHVLILPMVLRFSLETEIREKKLLYKMLFFDNCTVLHRLRFAD